MVAKHGKEQLRDIMHACAAVRLDSTSSPENHFSQSRTAQCDLLNAVNMGQLHVMVSYSTQLTAEKGPSYFDREVFGWPLGCFAVVVPVLLVVACPP